MKTILALSPKIKSYWIDSTGYYSMQSLEKFINYFFDGMNLRIQYDADTHANCDGVIYDIQDDYEMPSNKLNVMVCVENCSYWTHYNHYNKYGNYRNDNVKIYLYNHIDKIELTEKYIAIPIIYLQINYLHKFYNEIKPSFCMIPFEHKKFCLIATQLNSDFKIKITNALMTIQRCDFIHDFKPLIGNKSCYQDTHLLNLFNQYKFVFVSENSVCDGYITEKVFNCFFSRSVPIYYGSMKVKHFFNPDAVIHANGHDFNSLDRMVEQIKTIKDDKRLFESYTHCKIINDSFDNEQYKEKVNEFIDNFMNKNENDA